MPTDVTVTSFERQLVKYDANKDVMRRYLTDGLTPAQVATYWKQIDQGDLAAMVELAEEMESKDSRLYRLAARRRESVAELEWQIEATSGDESDFSIAEAIDEQLRAVNFEDALDHLLSGITSGLAVVELVWRAGRIREFVPVPGNRLRSLPWHDEQVRVTLDAGDWYGVPAMAGKFAVHHGGARTWYHTRTTLPRAASILYIAKHYALTDWLAFAEIFGMPWRIAKVASGENDETRKQLEKMLARMSADAYGVIPDTVSVDMIEPARGTQPFAQLIDMIHAEMSILYLGQTLTTEQGDSGAYALGKVHENVAASVVAADIRREANTVRQQILRPIVRFMLPRQPVQVPYFKRQIVSDRAIEAERFRVEQLKYADNTGFPVDAATRAEILDLPIPSAPAPAPQET